MGVRARARRQKPEKSRRTGVGDGSNLGVTVNSAGAVGVQPMVWGELRDIFLGLFHDLPAPRGATRLHALEQTPQDPELHPPVLIKHLSSNRK